MPGGARTRTRGLCPMLLAGAGTMIIRCVGRQGRRAGRCDVSAKLWAAVLIVSAIVLGACAPGAGVPRGDATSQGAPGQAPTRTLVVAMHVEPTSVAPRPPTTSGITPTAPTMLF